MNKDYIIDNISDETLAKITDKMLNFEKNQRARNVKANLLKIIPAVAAILLIIGFINIALPLLNTVAGNITSESDNNTTTSVGDSYTALADRGELFIPEVVEKSFFEDKILAKITDERSKDKFLAYYALRDINADGITERQRKEMLVMYPLCEFYVIYALDPNITNREKEQILDYIYDYTDITLNDLIQMYGYIDYTPRYPNVRFGDGRKSLLLDVEWYTYDTYLEYLEQVKDSDWYEDWYKEFMLSLLNRIKDKIVYMPKNINGKSAAELGFGTYVISKDLENPYDISEYCDSDGYYIYQIYPYFPSVSYTDENVEHHDVRFGKTVYANGCPVWNISNKAEYTKVLENEIIPFCDDLWERGLLTQEYYDFYTTPDPLEYYIDLFFN